MSYQPSLSPNFDCGPANKDPCKLAKALYRSIDADHGRIDDRSIGKVM
ncbi:hypothetical protein QN219_26710 [Sinorhizobium sp. 7-81]|nr:MULTISPECIES: hypothetical protein [unclassified Sinorhizobium]MDK1389312.1 hypothetical protein [Sinorhizobium sp. 7-81]MDK1493592.1 hypothetical protein [Sinorhizobium sp. 8-89]